MTFSQTVLALSEVRNARRALTGADLRGIAQAQTQLQTAESALREARTAAAHPGDCEQIRRELSKLRALVEQALRFCTGALASAMSDPLRGPVRGRVVNCRG
jgi:hypothetical protein